MVRSALEQLQGHQKTLRTIRDRLSSMFPESGPFKLATLKAILKEDLRYSYKIPQLRVVHAQREDVKAN